MSPTHTFSSSASIQPVIEALRGELRTTFDQSIVAHDIAHLDRVVCNAAQICDTEPDADRFVVAIAALLHDFHRVLEKQHRRHVTPEEAEPELRRWIAASTLVPASAIDRICAAVNFTEYYRCAGHDIESMAPSLEARIVRDADMLDALGAVGIARAFMFGGYLGEPMWVDTDPSSLGGTFVPGKATSVVHHFHEKLFRLESEMLTHRGKVLARARTEYMRSFLDTLMEDLRPPRTRRRPGPADR
ncbi:MAG TPA: HD domain-containing protein [Trinickia sp.]|uniref:HD domain-containing protein n=1 Tax=Trinickia sp. TaxID=2571163 RepID=UPI002F3E64A4